MKIIFAINLMCIITFFSNAQQQIISFPSENKNISVDNLNNIYLYNTSSIHKYNSTGNKIATYSNNKLGDIDKIDVSNPMKVLVLHKNQNYLSVLDNTLSLENNLIINLTELDLYNTSEFTYSAIDNGIWFYDKELLQLIKVDVNMNKTYESGNLLNLLSLDSLNVVDLVEYKNKLYLITDSNILVFDNFGAYYSTIKLDKIDKVLDIKTDIIYYINNNKIKLYNIKDFENFTIDFNLNNYFDISIKNNLIYIVNKGFLSVYKM